jgi:hypothetical protein
MPVSTYPDRAAWLAARSAPAPDGAPMIGASDVPAIFGLGFVSPARFAAQKRGLIARDLEPSSPDDPRAVGNRLEAAALAEYVEHHGTPGETGHLHTRITRWTHPDVPWLAVSPDALVTPDDLPSGDVLGLVQCKIPRSPGALLDYAPDRPEGYGIAATLADPQGPAVPRAYALQCLVELGVVRACGESEAAWIDLWCWPSPHWHRRVRLVWDDGADAAFAALVSAVGEWRQRHIIDGEPVPGSCPDDATIAVRLWSREGQHIAPGLARLAYEYEDARSVAALAEDRRERLRADLLAALGAHNVDTVIVPDPSADPSARTKAAREGKPGKISIIGKPGGVRSLRVTPGWLDTAAPGDLPPGDVVTPPAPLHVPGVTVGALAARWADRDDSAGPVDAPALQGADADLLADILAGL